MRKCLAVSVSLLAAIAWTAPPASAAPQDQVTGSAKINFGIGLGQFIVSAHGTPDDAHGRLKIRIPDTLFEDVDADVNCLDVRGNVANVGGTLRTPIEVFPGFVVRFVEATIVDNGTPGKGVTDLADAVLLQDDPAPACGFFAIDPAEQGNFTVQDR